MSREKSARSLRMKYLKKKKQRNMPVYFYFNALPVRTFDFLILTIRPALLIVVTR